MADQVDYVAKADGWVAGRRIKKGEPVKLTIAQAKYENVTAVVALSAEDPPKEPAPKRRRKPRAK